MTIAEAIDKLISIALSEVGYLEKRSNNNLYSKTANAGNANYTKYGYEMHKIHPSVMDYPAAWCDAFVDWCFVQAYGIDTAKQLLHSFDDYTVQSSDYFKRKGNWFKSPQRGDQIFFTNKNGGICHTGIVYAVDNQYVYTIEGNTSSEPGVVDNGGCVRKKVYTLTYNRIAGYGRPDWSLVGDSVLDPYNTSLNKLIANGYITDKDTWNEFGDFINKALSIALIDNLTGGTWPSEEADKNIHWVQPCIISLCGKKIIDDKTQWLTNPDAHISKALALALVDNATGGMNNKYKNRSTDHWCRNCLDSLCDKSIVTELNIDVWNTNFEGTVTKGDFMILCCDAFKL